MFDKSDCLDFSFDKYHQLCHTIIASPYKTMTLREYFQTGKPHKGFIIMRHDIDRKPSNSLAVAKLEHDHGITSTYYFRAQTLKSHPHIIKEIESLGHEAGYHYEVLSKVHGDHVKAIQLFENELRYFRELCDIKTICMHGNPLSKYDNRHLWKRYDFHTYGIMGEGYLSMDNTVAYFSDTGRNWNNKNKMRDLLQNNTNININKTDELLDIIKNHQLDYLYILTHPERWARTRIEWVHNYIQDTFFNYGKKALIYYYGK